MTPETRTARAQEIEQAAYAILAQKGYAGMSMLAVAKRARCSNETLYNWYGDKLGLVRAMVTRNAEEARALLEGTPEDDRPALQVLTAFGPVLLKLLLGERAVALNRAAAADPTQELGHALATAGRETVVPLLTALILRAMEEGGLPQSDPAKAADLYLRLLIGDLQIRRVIGRMSPLSEADITTRAEEALRGTAKILS
ncbi:MAG: TetR/AcrR family transcriptional regulator [Pseudomonadota bacterium]